jgi:hypothetical protein
MSSSRRSAIADIQGPKLRKRMRRMLVVRKSRLNVMLKIKEERATKSLRTYVDSTWPVIRRQIWRI